MRCPRRSIRADRQRQVLWTGRIISGLVVVFLLFDGAIKLVPLDIVITTSQELGFRRTSHVRSACSR